MSYNNEAKFYNQVLWSHFDKQISNSYFNLEQYAVKDEYGLSTNRLKVSIRQPKSNFNESLTLSYQDLFQILLKLKNFNDEISAFQKELSISQDKTKNYSFKFRSNFIISLLHRSEYGGLCCRIVVSKNDSYLDSEKVYMGIYDIASLLKLMVEYRDNYISISSLLPLVAQIDALNEKTSNIDTKLKDYYTEFLSYYQAEKLLQKQTVQLNDTPQRVEYDPFASESDKKIEIADVPQTPNQGEEEVLYSDLNKYLADNKDIKLDEPSNTEFVSLVTSTSLSDEGFTKNVLNNDLLNLEMYVTNLVNDDVPFMKWRNIIENKMKFTIFQDAHQSNIAAADYLISCYIKRYMKLNIESKKEFPSGVSTLVIPNTTISNNNLDLSYDLMLYFVYYGQLKNILKEKNFNPYHNKEFMTFALKALSAPFVFSTISNTTQETVASAIINKFRNYTKLDVFKNIEQNIFEQYSINFRLDESILKNEIDRLYSAFKTNSAKLQIDVCFSIFNFVKLNYDDFKNNRFNDEQIKKLIVLEFDESKLLNNDDIPIDVLDKYGIKKLKFDNSNLKRYIKDKCKDNEKLETTGLEIANNINQSYRDIHGKTFDLSFLSEPVLKAIYLWDLDKDVKIQNNYMYYSDLIEQCSLTKPMLIALISTKMDKPTEDFVSSYKASMDE